MSRPYMSSLLAWSKCQMRAHRSMVDLAS